MAYNGSVELISGIKQKNNGTFPLVDAAAVRIDDSTRLSDIDSPVLYGKTQDLSSTQKAQARTNIGAAGADDIDISVNGTKLVISISST